MRRGRDRLGRRERERRRAATARLLRVFQHGDATELLLLTGSGVRVVVDGGNGADGTHGRSATGIEAWRLLGDAVRRSQACSTDWRIGSVNGAPGLVGTRGGRVVEVVIVAAGPRALMEVFIVCDPVKLRHWNP